MTDTPLPTQSTFERFKSMVKRYSGYAMLVEPIWIKFYQWVATHPKTAAISLVVLALLALR